MVRVLTLILARSMERAVALAAYKITSTQRPRDALLRLTRSENNFCTVCHDGGTAYHVALILVYCNYYSYFPSCFIRGREKLFSKTWYDLS